MKHQEEKDTDDTKNDTITTYSNYKPGEAIRPVNLLLKNGLIGFIHL